MQAKFVNTRYLIKPDDRFHKLKVIKILPTNNQHTIVECKCDCGNIVIVRGSSLLNSHTKSCGCQKIDSSKIKKVLVGVSSLKSCYYIYRRGAMKRNLDFDLTIEQFNEITHRDCYYCGKKPSNSHLRSKGNGAYVYNGIDRIDNNKGYTMGNIVPCCKKCNFMKAGSGIDDFVEHINRIYDNLKMGDITHTKSRIISGG